ncbi:hypothetical protein BR93DRAFT_550248 [Coniochaeta sp. PMI_546]|nr:hypothetical protein BR93DRAFT_550248 [Coniochaeta sp. PMI_546]
MRLRGRKQQLSSRAKIGRAPPLRAGCPCGARSDVWMSACRGMDGSVQGRSDKNTLLFPETDATPGRFRQACGRYFQSPQPPTPTDGETRLDGRVGQGCGQGVSSLSLLFRGDGDGTERRQDDNPHTSKYGVANVSILHAQRTGASHVISYTVLEPTAQQFLSREQDMPCWNGWLTSRRAAGMIPIGLWQHHDLSQKKQFGKQLVRCTGGKQTPPHCLITERQIPSQVCGSITGFREFLGVFLLPTLSSLLCWIAKDNWEA